LGIGSLLAAPIVSEFCVVGVLEVFSPHARAFTYAHAVLLDQIVGIVPRIQGDTQPENTQSATPIEPDDVPVVLPPVESRLHSMAAASSEEPIEEKIEQKTKGNTEQENDPNTEVREQVLQVQVRNLEPESPTPPRLLYRALLGLAIAVAVTALGYVVGPAMKNWIHTPQVAQGSFVKAVKAAETTSPVSGQITGNRGPTGLSSATAKVSSINPRSPDPSPQPKSLPDLRKRADAGDADAQWLMGVRYHDGEGVPRDDGQAVQWFQRAAEQGNVAAQGALGAYFWRGRGVPEDLSKAYFWSDIAMAQGDELSKSRIEGLSSQMTSNQVAAARQRAEVWIRAHNQPAKSTGN
jgi:hypothetical protein